MLDKGSSWWKYIEINKLKSILDTIPENVEFITANVLGNLVLLNKDLKYIGYVDVAFEKLEML